MSTLTSGQRSFLRSEAHHLAPVVLIGRQGVTGAVIASADSALDARELIKVRFNDHKDEKRPLSERLAEATRSEIVGMVGHVVILYRMHRDPEKRIYRLP